MFPFSGELFELQENKIEFQEICQNLKYHSFLSPWSLCFNIKNGVDKYCEVWETNLPELNSLKSAVEQNTPADSIGQDMKYIYENNPIQTTFNEKNFLSLKTHLFHMQDYLQVEQFTDIQLLSFLSLSEMPKFCEFIDDVISNEESVALFLSIILNLEKPLSVSVISALIKYIVFPKIIGMKSSTRNLSSAILNFSRVYPTTVIDEILVPCLCKLSLETLLQEIIFKLVKMEIPNEQIGYSIKIILERAVPSENTFVMIQNLIERKIPYDSDLHNFLASSIEKWNSTNCRNMKFTKLLISILSTYGYELTQKQLEIYSEAIKVNKTIMKKAAENVMKKMK